MVLSFHFLRMPRPTHFLGLFDLQNGAELILTSVLLNKVSGLYGILAVFTGTSISGLQLSMYIYSIALAILLITLSPKIYHRDPLAVLSFAYLYGLDSLINALYTLLFGVSWFLALSSNHSGPLSIAGKTINSHTSPKSPTYNVTHAEVTTYPSSSLTEGQDAVAVGADIGGTGKSFLSAGVLQPESPTCILIISILWVVRAYFIIIVFAFARNVVRESATPGEAPFTGRNYGEGWRGELGRALVAMGRGYWQGTDGWAPFGTKFRRSRDERRGCLPPV